MHEPEPQCADAVLMIRPARFGFDAETAASNAFQRRPQALAPREVRERGRAEIVGLAARLEQSGVRVVLLEDTPEPPKPDACFPNNWLSTHADGTVVLYPMLAPARRAEVRPELVAALSQQHGYRVERVIDLAPLAERELFLEGTGSLVLDRAARVAYACHSPRTSHDALREFGERLEYDVVPFRAEDAGGRPIYHTNVMLALGERFAVVCLEALPDPNERELVEAHLRRSERDLIAITPDQLAHFCGNVLELRTADGSPVVALSDAALGAFEPHQRARLERHATLVPAPLEVIERCAGGSVRCALAELFLPRA